MCDVSDNPEQRGDLEVIYSEAADPSHGLWEAIQPQPFSLKGTCGTGSQLPISHPHPPLCGHFLPRMFPSPVPKHGVGAPLPFPPPNPQPVRVLRNVLTLAGCQAVDFLGFGGGAWRRGSPLERKAIQSCTACVLSLSGARSLSLSLSPLSKRLIYHSLSPPPNFLPLQ